MWKRDASACRSPLAAFFPYERKTCSTVDRFSDTFIDFYRFAQWCARADLRTSYSDCVPHGMRSIGRVFSNDILNTHRSRNTFSTSERIGKQFCFLLQVPWTSVSFTHSYILVFIHISPLAPFLLFTDAHIFLSSSLTLLFMKSCFLSFTQSSFLVSLPLSLLLPSTGSYFVLAISSSIRSFFLYSSDSSLLFLFADSSFSVRPSNRTNIFPFPTAICSLPTPRSNHLYANKHCVLSPIFYAKWSSYL